MTASHTQRIALLLIVLALFAIAAGEHFGWRALIDFAQSAGGGGLGLLTGEKLASVKNEDGGQITVNEAPKP